MLPFTLSSLLGRRRAKPGRSPRAQEPADMGTAFGMEQWLDERDHGATPAPAPAPAAPSANAAPARWMPRWLQLTRQPRS